MTTHPTGDAPAASEGSKLLEMFCSDMSEVIGLAKATDRQREVGKAWLRYAVLHALRKADERQKAMREGA